MRINELFMPASLEEAYELLMKHDQAIILGGGLYLRLQKRVFHQVIDLSKIPLDYIKEEEQDYIIGAMTSLRTLEKAGLSSAMTAALKQVGGLALRNLATLGGSICGRYPFSDVITLLLAYEATLVFYGAGTMSLESFLEKGFDRKDILKEVRLPKKDGVWFGAYKKTYTDFSIVNLALQQKDHELLVAIGARPGRASVKTFSQDQELAEILQSYSFADDFRAKGRYRQSLAKYLLENGLREVGS